MTNGLSIRDVMEVVVYGIFILTATRNVAYWWRMWFQSDRIAAERAAVRSNADSVHPDFEIHYVIPAYQEVESLPMTFRALVRSMENSKYRSRLTIVTSKLDEPRFEGEVRTRTVAEALCAEYPGARCIIDDSDSPSMAASFNTGVDAVARERTGFEELTYVAVYNADSSATLDSVQALGDTIVAREFPQVLQINYSSLRNLGEMSGLGGWYAMGAAYYQTRWAFGFEYDLHRRNSSARRAGPLGHSYHLKGHGLVLRVDTAVAVGGFSVDTPCEDLELGFRLSLQNIPVFVVPVVEDTEHPSTFSAVTAQKKYWFSGMVDVVNFHRLSPEQWKAQRLRFELQRGASLYRSAGCFLLAPVPYWILLGAAVGLGHPWLALPPLLNALASAVLLQRTLRRTGSTSALKGRIRNLFLPGAILVWSLTRNLGPVQYLWSILRTSDRKSRMRSAQERHIVESSGHTL